MVTINDLRIRVKDFLEENKENYETDEAGTLTKDVAKTIQEYFTQKVFPVLEIHLKSA